MSRRAKRHGGMDRVQSLIWDRYQSDPKRYSLKAMARAAGKNVTYIQQFLQYGTPAELPERARRSLANFLEVPEYELLPADLAEASPPLVPARRRIEHVKGEPVDEGELVPLSEVPTYLRPAVESLQLEVWRLLVNNLGDQFRVGDLVIVDLNLARRRPGCMVLATVQEKSHSRVIFRLSLPPKLFTVGTNTLELPETEDNERVVVRGVLLGRDEPVW